MTTEKGRKNNKTILLEEVFAFRNEDNEIVYKKNLSLLDDKIIKPILKQNAEKYILKYKELRIDEEESKYEIWDITKKQEKILRKLFKERSEILRRYLEKSDRNTNVMDLLLKNKIFDKKKNEKDIKWIINIYDWKSDENLLKIVWKISRKSDEKEKKWVYID